MEFPDLDVKGKIALVTGSSKGIGFGMAMGLAKYGADVVIVSRNLAEAETAAAEAAALGVRTLAVQCDVTKEDQVEQLVQKTVEHFGRIDILVNNAGMNIRKPLPEVDEADWDRVLNTNLKGVFLTGKAVAKQMIKQKGGKIINISSIFGGVAMPWQTCYAASKGGINQLTKVWALELAEHNIIVNAIAPAYIETPMTEGWLSDPQRLQQITESTALKRVGKMHELVGPVVFLASEAASYITGHVLYVDGGWLAK